MRPLLLLAFACGCAVPVAPIDEAAPVSGPDLDRGRQLFLHAFTEHDPLAKGNGLGPVANARSCVDCHAAGGLGGAGPQHRNVRPPASSDGLGTLPNVVGDLTGGLGLAGRGLGGLGLFGASPSGPRNTPALFGAGLIDAIPDEVLELRAADFGGVVGRDERGRATRFGWKAEVAGLREFVSQACALELGLTTSTHAELAGPKSDGSPPVDLDDTAVDALAAFVAALPSPEETLDAEDGRARFEAIGCADCHAPTLGAVEGIYADLLLHDLGPRLADRGSIYGGAQPAELARYWRTPPLWGVRDSGPWLHDGRASSLEQAIRLHSGEADDARERFEKLDDRERQSVIRFLESLVAPGLS